MVDPNALKLRKTPSKEPPAPTRVGPPPTSGSGIGPSLLKKTEGGPQKAPAPARTGPAPAIVKPSQLKEAPKPSKKLPPIVAACIETLEKRAKEEGIFRDSSKGTEAHELKASFIASESVDLSEKDVHVVAELLKLYFHDLDSSILVINHYTDAIGLEDNERRLIGVKEAVAKLNEDNALIVTALFGLLKTVADNSASNQMDAQSLGTAWAPSLFKSDAPEAATIVSYLITSHDQVFEIKSARKMSNQPKVLPAFAPVALKPTPKPNPTNNAPAPTRQGPTPGRAAPTGRTGPPPGGRAALPGIDPAKIVPLKTNPPKSSPDEGVAEKEKEEPKKEDSDPSSKTKSKPLPPPKPEKLESLED